MPELTENELWLQGDEFGGVDFSSRAEPEIDNSQVMIAPDLIPEIITNVEPESEPEPQPTPEPVAQPEPEVDEPLIFTNPDGSYSRIEKSSKGWKGTVDIGTGSSQVYYGKTKDELIQNLLTAQIHATKKIREQNRTIKLGSNDEAVPTITKVERKIGRSLTADEKIELKLLFETDPDEAFATWFEKRSGRSLDKLVANADAGEKANRALAMEEANKGFLAANPTYYGDENWENYNSLITYLAKNKLRRGRKTGDNEEILEALVDNGFYTASNLEEAFTELTEAGLLLAAPRTPEKPAAPAPKPAPVTPVAHPERIVRTETRPRAGLGITSREVTQNRVPEPTPLSDTDLNKLSDDEIEAAINAHRQAYRASRR